MKRFSMTSAQIEEARKTARKRMKRGLRQEVIDARRRMEEDHAEMGTTHMGFKGAKKIGVNAEEGNPRKGQTFRLDKDSKGRDVHRYAGGKAVVVKKDHMMGSIQARGVPSAPSPKTGQPAPKGPVDNTGQNQAIQLQEMARRRAERKRRKPFPLPVK